MLKLPVRRLVAAMLAILGAALMYFAIETWAGALLLALGISVELAGIALRRQDS